MIITDIAQETDHCVTIIEYRVENHESTPIWLVNDGWLVWRQQGVDIELSYARGTLQPGVEVFGYFNPKVVKVQPQKSVMRHVELKWPLSLSRLWNTVSTASLQSGVYHVSILIGYGLTREPPKPALGESVEAPVLRWQREAKSPPVLMRIDHTN